MGATTVLVTSSAAVTGSRVIPSEEIDRAFGMPLGKLRQRAGIASLAYAAEEETELNLGAKAAEEALRAAGCASKEIDRKSTRLNSSHGYISYAVFCLKKKKKTGSGQREVG